ncbi:ABC transporter substrate-binding protein [Calidifontibacter terrae]
MGLAACGSDSSGGTPTLTWYINPDVGNADATKGGQATLAKQCADASQGKYKINIQLLPNSASDQRLQLLRRLAAGDSSMDLMSVDPAFTTEFAAAGYYAPVPSDMVATFKDDRVQSSIDASTYKDKLVSVPFWSNTQLLWYKKSVASKAGLDMTKPVTWDQLVAAAQKTKTQIGVQAKLYEGYAVWINALIAGAGGQIVANPGATYESLKLGIDTDAGRTAASIIHKVASSGVAGPAVGSSTETESLGLFGGKTGGFLVNWPYTYGALTGKGGAMETSKDDVAAAFYPQSVAGKDAKPPYGGIQIAVGKSSSHTALAYQAAACITDVKHQTEYMVNSGNPASRKAAFDDPAVKKAFPNRIAALIRTSLDNAAPRPLTQYWGDISTALQQQFSPPQGVTTKTPATSSKFILDVLNGKALL